MDKNQSVITLIIIVLVVVCAFLYFVFRPQTSDEMIDVEEENGSYSFDVDVVEPGDDSGEVIAEIENIAKDHVQDNGNTSNPVAVKKQERVSSPAQASPDTGPGSIALIVSAFLGVIGAFGFHKKMNKKS